MVRKFHIKDAPKCLLYNYKLLYNKYLREPYFHLHNLIELRNKTHQTIIKGEYSLFDVEKYSPILLFRQNLNYLFFLPNSEK